MKIVCDACQAKYSISDDKVQGKVFKIRCKKCSNIIVVRGGAGAAEPVPAPQQEKDTRVYDYGYDASGEHAPAGDEPVWHVVINQDQVGPMTAVEVQQKFSGGEIDSETYIWREGFADWLPLAQVDTFAQLVSAGPAAATSSRSGADAVASMFGGGEDSVAGVPSRSDPGDLFAAATGSAAGRNDDDGGDLFGSKPAAQSSHGGAKLRGERNENSVLFSLNNLAQLASDKPAPTPAHSPASSSSTSMAAAGGGSGGEGSGLIDIRSMASAYLGGPGGGAAKPTSAGIGSIDDLPVFGGGGFSEPAVIVPIAARSGGNNKLMYALIGSVGLLAVAAVIVVVVLLRGDKPKVAQLEPDRAEVKAPEAKPPEVKPPETPAVVEPKPGSAETPPSAAKDPVPSAKDPVKVAAGDPPAEPKHTAAPVHKTPSSTPSTQPAQPRQPKQPVEKTTPPVVKDPPVAKDPGGASCDEVSCVLNNYEGACCAKFKRGGKPTTPSGTTPPKAGDLPESLDRTMISDGVGKVKPRVMSCGEKSPAKGQVKVSVRVGPDGHVVSVTVKNTPDAGLGSCVASMMQKATFAKTQNGGSFAYPYTF